MAYEIKPFKDEEEKQAGGLGGGPVVSTGAAPMPAHRQPASMTAAAAGGAYAPGTPSAPGSKFVNFDRVLNANKDVATRNANDLADDFENKGNRAWQTVQGKVAEFNQQVGPYGTARQPTTLTSNLGRGGGRTVDSASPKAPIGLIAGNANPNQPKVSIDTLSNYEIVSKDEAARRANAQYTGPRSLGDVEGGNQAIVDAQKAFGMASGLTNDNNLAAAIQGKFGSMVGTGGNRMDSALIGATGGERFSAMGDKFKKLDAALGQAQTDASAKGQKAEADARAKAEYWKGQLDSYQSPEDVAKAPGSDPELDKALAVAQGSGRMDFLKGEKGGWGQVDAGAAGAGLNDVFNIFGSKSDASTYQTDAGSFARMMKDAGYDDLSTRQLYEKLDVKDLQELRWLKAGPGGAPEGRIDGWVDHPAFAGLDPKQMQDPKARQQAIKNAMAAWFARMQKKYGF